MENFDLNEIPVVKTILPNHKTDDDLSSRRLRAIFCHVRGKKVKLRWLLIRVVLRRGRTRLHQKPQRVGSVSHTHTTNNQQPAVYMLLSRRLRMQQKS